jgi:hypothetical protein
MSEAVLLGVNGWAASFHERVREHLYLLLDDGWETGGTSTFELDSAEFPSFKGSPADRLGEIVSIYIEFVELGAPFTCREAPDRLQWSERKTPSEVAQKRGASKGVSHPLRSERESNIFRSSDGPQCLSRLGNVVNYETNSVMKFIAFA